TGPAPTTAASARATTAPPRRASRRSSTLRRLRRGHARWSLVAVVSPQILGRTREYLALDLSVDHTTALGQRARHRLERGAEVQRVARAARQPLDPPHDHAHAVNFRQAR